MAKKQKLAGLREARQKRYRAATPSRRKAKAPVLSAAEPEAGQARTELVRLKLGPGGRFVIPKKLRQAMEIETGDLVLAEVVDGELRMWGFKVGLRKAQELAKPYRIPGVSIVDELIEDRRREFELEERKHAADRRWAARRKRDG